MIKRELIEKLKECPASDLREVVVVDDCQRLHVIEDVVFIGERNKIGLFVDMECD